VKKRPRLRSVSKYEPPFPLNQFPPDFDYKLGKEIIYLLATRGHPKLEGDDWEQIFARCIGARWKPSNVGLDDVVLEATAWSAKTVKNNNPTKAKKVRLISGRNSPTFSFEVDQLTSAPATKIAKMVLEIWNERVISVRSQYESLRTVVLLKAEDLLEASVFEFQTQLYDPSDFDWSWNIRRNLEGRLKSTGEHRFTWQPHGSQFTIIEPITEKRLAIGIRQPPPLNPEKVLETLEVDRSWVRRLS
jgi:hypothetical protein